MFQIAINRLNVILAGQNRTNRWLLQYQNGVQMKCNLR